MRELRINFLKTAGKIKPMHAVNNGPVYKFASDQRITNIDAYRAAGIPFARTHDASFYATYGGEHCVDVHAIFPNFDADPEDPASYDFVLTDEYLKVIHFAGTKVFYRLGSKIEHWPKKYGTLPPKDFKKWAVICEHIIRHYTEGWADGFHYDIPYWEIWNEPDLDPDDSTHKRNWGGTKLQYFELYHVAANHLKTCFPHLKIGGPALGRTGNWTWLEDFLKQLQAPLDFFSWHVYANTTDKIEQRARDIRRILDQYGYTETESILNEWNYVRGWRDEEWIYSLKTEKGLKGSSFIAATMCEGQRWPLDMLMYYDARPCGMNGLFNTDFVFECLKGYYPFKAFNELYTLQGCVHSESDCADVYVCAAKGDGEAAILLTHYSDDDTKSPEDLTLRICGFTGLAGVKAEFYLLDEKHDLELVKEELFGGSEYSLPIRLPLFGTYLVKLKKF